MTSSIPSHLTPDPSTAAQGRRSARFDPSKQTLQLSTGIRLAYVEAGDPEGAVVILLHGYTDTARSFFPTLEHLSASGAPLHLYALDHRGHGGSSMPDAAASARAPEQGFAIAQLAADVIAFMDAKGVRRAHVVGHSLGSIVAQELALSEPDRVQSLLLVGTFACATDNAAIWEFLVPTIEGTWKRALESRPGFAYPEDAYSLTPDAADPDVENWLRANWVAEVTAPAEHLAAVLPETASTRLGTWIGSLRAQQGFDNRARLAKLRVPTCVIAATQDNFFPKEPDQRRVLDALNTAVDAGQLESFVYKTYGKQPLPASGNPESDLGHNMQWGAGESMAADLTAWVTTGRPTTTLPYADPENPRRVLQAAGAATLIERRRGGPSRAAPRVAGEHQVLPEQRVRCGDD